MKKTNILLIALIVMVLVLPTALFAAPGSRSLSLTVKAKITAGAELATDAVKVYKCDGSKYTTNSFPNVLNGECSVGDLADLNFGELERLYTAKDGSIKSAGGFYSKWFYAIYFYPSCWGGAKYELQQAAVSMPHVAFENALRRTVVFTTDDLWDATDANSKQNDLDTINGESCPENGKKDELAKNAATILVGNQDHIVSVWYGIPMTPEDTADRTNGKYGIPFNTPANTYEIPMTITFTQNG